MISPPPGGNVFMQGGPGNTTNSFAQIGHLRGTDTGATNTGNIAMTGVGGSITLNGGAGVGNFALIGHGGRTTTAPDSYTGTIAVSSTGPISLTGGTADQTFASIGPTAYLSSAGVMTISCSSYSVSTGSSLNLQANSASEAIIGSRIVAPGGSTVNYTFPTFSVTAPTSISLIGAPYGSNPYDVLLGVFASQAVGNQTNIGSFATPLTLSTGELLIENAATSTSMQSFAMITNGYGTATGSFPVSITTTENCTMLSGKGQSIINTAGTTSTATMSIGGDLNLESTDSSVLTEILNFGSGLTHITVTNGLEISTGLIFGGGDLTLSAGNISLLNDGFITGNGTMTISSASDINLSNSALIENNLAGTTTVTATGDLFLTSGISGSGQIMGTADLLTVNATNIFVQSTPEASSLITNGGPLTVGSTHTTSLQGSTSHPASISTSAGALSLNVTTLMLSDNAIVSNIGSGTTTVTATGDIFLTSGTSGSATISGTTNSSLSVGAANNLFMTGSSTSASVASITNGGPLTINSGTISLNGGYVSGGTPNAFISASSGDLSITARTELSLINAQILNTGSGTTNLQTNGNLSLQSFANASLLSVVTSIAGNTGAMTITADELSLIANGPAQFVASNVQIINNGPLFITAGNSCYLMGNNSDGFGQSFATISTTSGDLTLVPGVSEPALFLGPNASIENTGSGTTTITTLLSADLDGGSIIASGHGALTFTATGSGGSGGSINLINGATVTSNGPLSVMANQDLLIDPGSTVIYNGTTDLVSVVTTLGDILISDNAGINNTGSGTTTVTAGSTLTILGGINGNGFIQGTTGTMNITTGGNFHMLSTEGGSAMITNQGSINITSGQNILLGGFAPGQQTSITTSAGNILATANFDVLVRENARISNTGTGNITLVADQNPPTPPNIGTGRFVLDPSASLLTSGGLLRIFTARPSQNIVQGSLNGIVDPATGGNPSPTEQYSTFYNTFIGGFGVPYTIFYKIGGPAPVNTSSELASLAFVSAEMSFNLRHFDEYLWLKSYRECYEGKKNKYVKSIYDISSCYKHPAAVKNIDYFLMDRYGLYQETQLYLEGYE